MLAAARPHQAWRQMRRSPCGPPFLGILPAGRSGRAGVYHLRRRPA